MALPGRVLAMIRGLSDGRGDVAKLATGGAWLFAVGSLFPLAWLLSEGGGGHVFGTHVGDRTYTVPLLTYAGAAGMLLLCAQMLAVAGAFLLTITPRVPRKLAHIGHVVLIAWSVLWMAGAWRLAMVDAGFWTAQALFLTILCGCTMWRAWRSWSPISAAPPSASMQNDAAPSYFDEVRPQAAKPSSQERTRTQIAEAARRAREAALAASRTILVGVKAGFAAARDHHAKV